MGYYLALPVKGLSDFKKDTFPVLRKYANSKKGKSSESVLKKGYNIIRNMTICKTFDIDLIFSDDAKKEVHSIMGGNHFLFPVPFFVYERLIRTKNKKLTPFLQKVYFVLSSKRKGYSVHKNTFHQEKE